MTDNKNSPDQRDGEYNVKLTDLSLDLDLEVEDALEEEEESLLEIIDVKLELEPEFKELFSDTDLERENLDLEVWL